MDEEKACDSAGTGFLSAGARPIIKPDIKSTRLQAVINKGRLSVYSNEITEGIFVMIYNVNGRTGASGDKLAAARTDNLIDMVLEDWDMQEDGPKMLVGDLNGNLADFPALTLGLETNALIDLVSIASKYGNPMLTTLARRPMRTKPPGGIMPSNVEAEDWAHNFYVDHDSNLPTHDVLCIEFKDTKPSKRYNAVTLPGSLY